MIAALSMFHFGRFGTDINKVYRAAVSGGHGKVLALMEPVLLTSKLGLWVQSIACFVGAGFIAEMSVPLVMERWTTALDTQIGSNDGMFIFMIDFILVGICWYMSLSAAKKCQPIPASSGLERQKNWLCFHRIVQYCIDLRY